MLHLLSDSNLQAEQPETLHFLLFQGEVSLGTALWSADSKGPVAVFGLTTWKQEAVGQALSSFFQEGNEFLLQVTVEGVTVLCPERGR